MIIVVLLIAIVVLCVFIWNRHPRVNLKYSSIEGEFHVQGIKKNFQIRKDDRFIFNVVDGRVVSFVDKSVSNETVEYKEEGYGDF